MTVRQRTSIIRQLSFFHRKGGNRMKHAEKEEKQPSFLKRHFNAIATICIVLIPTIYTTLFLGSMWDPYGNVSDLPVAVVNQDQSVTFHDQTLSIGDDLIDNLKDNDSLDFSFVDAKTAQDGLEDGTYYMAITIPEDTSANASTVLDDTPKKVQLYYETNPGTNYIASKMSETAMQKLKTEVSSTITEAYTETLFDQIGTAGDGMQDAADGAKELDDGAQKLKDGSVTLSDNLKVLADSTLTLEEGCGTLTDGLTAYTDGVAQVDDGAKQLEDGMTEKKAIAIINKAKKTGKYDEVKKAGLENFKRDTLWVAVLDTVFPKGFNADSMRYVPYGGGAQFEMAIRNDTAKSGAPFCLLEVKTPYETYLNGLDKQEIANMKDVQTKLGKYCGLMIGSLETANNNAGNWE